MTERRGGPARMEPAELAAFLAQPRWVGVCFEDRDGSLRAVPMWMEVGGLDRVELTVADGAESGGVPDAPACLVADRFDSYAGIRGAILRGALAGGDDHGGAGGRRTLRVATAHGFSFEGTTVSL